MFAPGLRLFSHSDRGGHFQKKRAGSSTWEEVWEIIQEEGHTKLKLEGGLPRDLPFCS